LKITASLITRSKIIHCLLIVYSAPNNRYEEAVGKKQKRCLVFGNNFTKWVRLTDRRQICPVHYG